MRRLCALLLCAAPVNAAPMSAWAQALVVSPAADSASVTVYRDPGRGEGRIQARLPGGYALISEKRRVRLPAGPATLRFEGVADGMIAVSAVVSGLPGKVDEKNRDARLLSPAALLDGSLGNRVHIRRTNKQTGKVSEIDAIVRSGPDNALVLETAEGIEALRCSGLPEAVVYDGVPPGLSAKPSFTINTVSPAATEAELTLTYLATGFDWGASYVAKVAQDGRTLDLSAWLTVANGNGADYPAAQLLAVAGAPNRESDGRDAGQGTPSPVLNLQCWPMDGTSTHPRIEPLPPPAPPPPPMMYEMAMSAPAPVMMRANKAAMDVMARQEELGDLKLYRVPMRVDISPNGQKQVALLAKEKVPFTRFYGAALSPFEQVPARPLDIMLRMQNRTKDGLGLPLPSGGVIVSQARGDDELLLADSRIADKAIGEKVELAAGTSEQVRVAQETLSTTEDGKERRVRITLSNALDGAVPVEIVIPRVDGHDLVQPGTRLGTKDGGRLWTVSVPANGTAKLEYTLRRQ